MDKILVFEYGLQGVSGNTRNEVLKKFNIDNETLQELIDTGKMLSIGDKSFYFDEAFDEAFDLNKDE